jgi:hypothetical protein
VTFVIAGQREREREREKVLGLVFGLLIGVLGIYYRHPFSFVHDM